MILSYMPQTDTRAIFCGVGVRLTLCFAAAIPLTVAAVMTESSVLAALLPIGGFLGLCATTFVCFSSEPSFDQSVSVDCYS
eukprot:SAG31_NODE_4819_length_2933_cov_1.577629_3_plen_81_part_00